MKPVFKIKAKHKKVRVIWTRKPHQKVKLSKKLYKRRKRVRDDE